MEIGWLSKKVVAVMMMNDDGKCDSYLKLQQIAYTMVPWLTIFSVSIQLVIQVRSAARVMSVEIAARETPIILSEGQDQGYMECNATDGIRPCYYHYLPISRGVIRRM